MHIFSFSEKCVRNFFIYCSFAWVKWEVFNRKIWANHVQTLMNMDMSLNIYFTNLFSCWLEKRKQLWLIRGRERKCDKWGLVNFIFQIKKYICCDEVFCRILFCEKGLDDLCKGFRLLQLESIYSPKYRNEESLWSFPSLGIPWQVIFIAFGFFWLTFLVQYINWILKFTILKY